MSRVDTPAPPLAPTWGRRLGAQPLIIGHRGAAAHELENTIPAFRRARADGADGVELDVFLAHSGEVVVFHDDDLVRLGAGRRQRVEDLTLTELRAVTLRDADGREGCMPTLSEVLEELGPLLVNVELKAPRPWSGARLVPQVADVLASHNVGDRVLVSSFNPLALAQLRARQPRVLTGLLCDATQAPPLREAWARHVLRPAAIHPHHSLVDPYTISAWHAEGRAVYAWTVDLPAEAVRLAQLGVDGVITNDPAMLRHVFPKYRS